MGASGRIVAAAAALSLAVASGSPAQADQLRLKVDWGRTLVQGQQWLAAGAEAEKASDDHAAASESKPSPDTGWIGSAPHLSVVGRDWDESHLFMGRLVTTDVFRLSRSNRTTITRVDFGDGFIVPFAQLGFGQWRVDRNVLPRWACDVEVAGQLGAGLEIKIGHGAGLAFESDYTVLYRDQREPQNVPYPRHWRTMAAARFHF